MRKSTPVRIDEELYHAASQAASVMSRSTAEQLTHWTRIGRELEASPEVSIDQVAKVLRGAGEYDALGTEEQAVVRAYWSERMATLQGALRLDQEFELQGHPYVELNDEGKVVRREIESSGRTRVG